MKRIISLLALVLSVGLLFAQSNSSSNTKKNVQLKDLNPDGQTYQQPKKDINSTPVYKPGEAPWEKNTNKQSKPKEGFYVKPKAKDGKLDGVEGGYTVPY